MIKYIETDDENYVYCSSLHDGRIRKVFLKKTHQEIYVCEECECTWLTLNDIFFKVSRRGLMVYLEDEGHIEVNVPPNWEEVLEDRDFVEFDEVKPFVEKYGIKVVMVEG